MSPNPKRWQILEPAPSTYIERLSHVHRITAQILHNRGLTDPQEAEDFLHKTYRPGDPLHMKGIAQAVRNIERAILAEERIAVYGDFDVDGVTATALMVQTLQALGAESVVPYIPHRTQEEHGLNIQALRKLWRDGVRLVITVDCGIRDVDEVEQARPGLDVIITDHHSVGPTLPPALAIVNPKQADCPYPFKKLAGVGVAFKLAQALLRSSHLQTNLKRYEPPLSERDLLDLVALGTVADMTPLVGENRALVHRGLEHIKNTERPGLEALCWQAGIKPAEVDATAISYMLGPRLNAAGRMARADMAYDLLMTRHPGESEKLARELEQLNRKRQRITKELQERADEIALAQLSTADARPMSADARSRSALIFVEGAEFLAGLAGLVAGRLVERFYRPAVVVERKEVNSRGSARSIPEFHITHALDKCTDLLLRHGGHRSAAGFTARTEDLAELRDRLSTLATEALESQELEPTLQVDAKLPLQTMNWPLWNELQQIAPFGERNPEPLFASYDVHMEECHIVGSDGAHLKLLLSDGQTRWDGIAFRQGELVDELPSKVDIAYHLQANEWNGQRQLQLNIQDIRPARTSVPTHERTHEPISQCSLHPASNDAALGLESDQDHTTHEQA